VNSAVSRQNYGPGPNRLKENFREHAEALRTQVDAGVNAGFLLAKLEQSLEGAVANFTEVGVAAFLPLCLWSRPGFLMTHVS
jgi:hypothetical protein